MSAIAAAPPSGAAPAGAPSGKTPQQQLKTFMKVVGVVWILGIVVFAVLYGITSHKAPSVASGAYTPIDEFRLDTWFKIGPIDFNKGILYLLLAGALTVGVGMFVAHRLKMRPTGRMQVAVETVYEFTRNIAFGNMDERLARKYFPLIQTIFIFILVSNLLGYVPLPVDTGQKVRIFGVYVPSFQIYAADTNVAFPLTMALGVFVIFTYEGIRAHGPIGFLKNLMPGGVKGAMVPLIFGIEVLSYFLRLISLTVRLWANLLAGHLLIAFMGGELGVLVGLPFVSWGLLPIGIAIFLFEAVLIAGLQAFIFAILTAIYLGSSVSSH